MLRCEDTRGDDSKITAWKRLIFVSHVLIFIAKNYHVKTWFGTFPARHAKRLFHSWKKCFNHWETWKRFFIFLHCNRESYLGVRQTSHYIGSAFVQFLVCSYQISNLFAHSYIINSSANDEQTHISWPNPYFLTLYENLIQKVTAAATYSYCYSCYCCYNSTIYCCTCCSRHTAAAIYNYCYSCYCCYNSTIYCCTCCSRHTAAAIYSYCYSCYWC